MVIQVELTYCNISEIHVCIRERIHVDNCLSFVNYIESEEIYCNPYCMTMTEAFHNIW